MRWKPCTPYFLISAICFLAAAGSAIVDSLGPPLVFGFATLCSVFLAFGALATEDLATQDLATKDSEQARSRDGDSGRAP